MAPQKITAENLESLMPLFSKSAGYEVAFVDELDCLKNMGGFGFFIAEVPTRPCAFIRCYPISQNIHLLEVFPKQGVQTPNLLKEMIGTFSSFPGHSFRVDFSVRNAEIVEHDLKNLGFSRVKHFLYYEILCDRLATPTLTKITQAAPKDAAIICTLLHGLHRYTNEEVLKGIENGHFWVCGVDSISAVAKISLRTDQNSKVFELVEFAVDPNQLRKGIGSKFLLGLMNLFVVEQKAKQFHLKVESTKLPAIRCYESLGFTQNLSKSEKWFYFDVPALK